MKKSLLRVGVAVSVAALMLSACSSDSDGEEAPSASGSGDQEEVTLTFWSHTHDPMNVLTEKIIADYEAENSHIKVEYTVMPNADFFTKMITALSTGAGPDVININDVGLRGDYIPKGLIAELDPAPFGEDSVDKIVARYTPSALDGVTGPDGKVYGIPSEFNAMAFAINTQHFADAGLDVSDAPTTWDEVIEVGKQLVEAGHTQAFGFNYLHASSYEDQLSMLLAQTGGTIVNSEGTEATLDTPEGIEALQLWKDLATSGIGDPNVTTKDANNQVADLEAGVQSMMALYPWGFDQIRQNNPEVYEQLVLVPLPQLDPANPVGHGNGYYWAVNQSSTQQEEAWKFINFMSSYSEQWLSDVSFVQPYVDWQSSAAAQEVPFIDVWAIAYETAGFATVSPHWAEVQDAIMNGVNDIVFNDADPAEIAAAINSRVAQSISE